MRTQTGFSSGKNRNRKKQQQKRRNIIFAAVILSVLVAGGTFAYKEIFQGSGDDGSFTRVDGTTDEIIYNGKKYEYNTALYNYLFMGIDKREISEEEGYQSGGRADAVFLVSYDSVKNSLRTMSIPRDTITLIERFTPDGTSLGKGEDHLSMQFQYGDGRHKSGQLMAEAVSNLLYGVPVDGYCAVTLDGIIALSDLVGGFPVVVPDDSLEEKYPEFKKGETVIMTSGNAEAFVRTRDITRENTALERMNRQKVYLRAFATKVKELEAGDPSIVSEIYDALTSYMVASVDNGDFIKLFGAEKDMDMESIPGKGIAAEDYDEFRVDEAELYAMVIDYFYTEKE